jgi:hypothetical protein
MKRREKNKNEGKEEEIKLITDMRRGIRKI